MTNYKDDFPILFREIKPGIELVYLDSTATSQKPKIVIEAMDEYYRKTNANVHRGIHFLAEEATTQFELAREKVAKFIHAPSSRQIIFTKNATESLNLIIYSWGKKFLNDGDIVILTEMEHHANLVPWHILMQEKKIQLEFIPVNSQGLLDLQVYANLLNLCPKVVSFTHMSNVLGTINPAKEIVSMAKQKGAVTIIDGAQSAPHFPVNVSDLDTDFFVFSAHKMCGPTGIGVLYGRKNLLETTPPFLGGGDMIKQVHLRSYIPNEIPYKFEAGTPPIAEAIGLGSAIDYLNSIGMDVIALHEKNITGYALEKMKEIPGLIIYGPPIENKGGVISFSMSGLHPHDISQILDEDGIAIRAGHHCAMPLHEKLGLIATSRASFYLYNSYNDVDKLINGLLKAKQIFGIH
jgi:cysteine desulfurase/selenocysteine lyase